MELEPLPIVLLGVDVAFAFYVLKYYQGSYRRHIEKNRTTLQKVGMLKLDKLLQDTRDQVLSGTYVDAKPLQRGLDAVVALVNSQANIRKYQSGVLFFLLITAVVSIWASYAPTLVLWQTSIGPVTLLVVALFFSTVVFATGYLLLRRVQWFHDTIPVETSPPSAS